jgi:hypothetical protein
VNWSKSKTDFGNPSPAFKLRRLLSALAFSNDNKMRFRSALIALCAAAAPVAAKNDLRGFDSADRELTLSSRAQEEGKATNVKDECFLTCCIITVSLLLPLTHLYHCFNF